MLPIATMVQAGGAIAGALGGLLGTGKKPKLPTAPEIDTTKEQGTAIAGNLQNLSSMQQLASKTNTFNQEQMMAMLAKQIPGYQNLMGQATENMQSQLKGEIPEDVQRAIQNATAARAISGGFAGSGMHRNLTARDFGLTSLQLSDKALSQFNQFTQLQASLMPQMFNVASMMVSPAERIASVTRTRDLNFQAALGQSMINAAPDPKMAALGSGISMLGGYASQGGFNDLFKGSTASAIPNSSFMNTSPYDQNQFGGIMWNR